MNCRKVLADILPFRLTNFLRSRRKFRIEENLNLGEDDKEEIYYFEDNANKKIISVQGFGYSGSGAVIDLLREYKGICTWGSYEIEYLGEEGKSLIEETPFEVDILRQAGGLFELEKYIDSDDFFCKDAAIKRFIRFIDSFITNQRNNSIFKSPQFKNIVARFLDSIIAFRINTGKEYPYNTHLWHREEYKKNYIYFLKRMKVDNYRVICASFLRNIFSLVESKTLVLDQFLMDGELDYERNKSYLPNHKIIMVYRDPRDVFAIGITKNIPWIPKDGKIFSEWYKTLHSILENTEKYPDIIVVRFEELVLSYDATIQKIEDFVGLKNSDHIKKKGFFDPAISIQNIGLYKFLSDNYNIDIRIIENSLSRYCFKSTN